jgi:hypothetical protein
MEIIELFSLVNVSHNLVNLPTNRLISIYLDSNRTAACAVFLFTCESYTLLQRIKSKMAARFSVPLLLVASQAKGFIWPIRNTYGMGQYKYTFSELYMFANTEAPLGVSLVRI